MELLPSDFEAIPEDKLLAFNVGERELGIGLYGDVQRSNGPVSERLVDTSMKLTLEGAVRTAWDRLRIDHAVGTYPITITAGDKPANTLDLVVVDHADSLAALANQATSIMSNQAQSICFQALAADRYIAGLTWTFTVDGAVETHGDGDPTRNCVSVSTIKTAGTVTVQASAGGQAASVALTVNAAPRRVIDLTAAPIRMQPAAITVEGDRAAM